VSQRKYGRQPGNACSIPTPPLIFVVAQGPRSENRPTERSQSMGDKGGKKDKAKGQKQKKSKDDQKAKKKRDKQQKDS